MPLQYSEALQEFALFRSKQEIPVCCSKSLKTFCCFMYTRKTSSEMRQQELPKTPKKGQQNILYDAFNNTCSIRDSNRVHGSTGCLFQRCEGLIETHGIYRISPGQRGSAISLETMQTDTSFIRKALILAGHLIEAHLGAQLVRPELFLGVVGPVFIEGVAPQSSHRGPFGISLLFPPGIGPLPWVGGTLSCRVSICSGIVALP